MPDPAKTTFCKPYRYCIVTRPLKSEALGAADDGGCTPIWWQYRL
jgi:hypothetical protein